MPLSAQRAPARSALALAVALLIPGLVGLVTSLVADRIAGSDQDDGVVQANLALLLTLSSVLSFACHMIAAIAAGSLLRHAPFSASPLAQPVVILGALRPVGAALLAASAHVPSLREPLVGISLALVDAVFVAACLLVVAPVLGAAQGRARAVAAFYALARVAFAVTLVGFSEAWPALSLAHRLIAACATAAVAIVLAEVSKSLRRAEV